MTKTNNNSTIATAGIPFSYMGMDVCKGICNTVYGRIHKYSNIVENQRVAMEDEASSNGDDSRLYERLAERVKELESDIETLRSYVSSFETKHNEMSRLIGDGRLYKYQPFIPMAKAS